MRNLLTIAALLFALAAHAQGTGPMRPDQNIPFTGQVTTPSCTLSVTTGNISVTAAPPCASASSQGVAWNLVGPLTGNATLQFPTGLRDGFSMGFLINHGTGGYTLSFASGYIFPGAILSGGQPILTNVADAPDMVICQSISAPLPGTISPSVLSMWCGSPPLNMTAVSASKTWIQGALGSNSTTTSAAVTLPNPVGSGHSVVCTALSSTGGSNQITGISDGHSGSYTQLDWQAFVTGASAADFYAINLTNGAQTITVTYSGSQAFSQVECDEYSNVTALDGHSVTLNIRPGTGANLVTTPSITTTNNGDVIWGANWNNCSSAAVAVGTGFTLRTGTGTLPSEDLTQTIAGSIAATFTDATHGASCRYIPFVVALH